MLCCNILFHRRLNHTISKLTACKIQITSQLLNLTCFLLRCLPMILTEIKRCFFKMMEDQFAAFKRIFPCSFELDLLFSWKFLRSYHISTCYSIRYFSWNLCVQANSFDIFLPDDFLLLELFEDTIIESIILFFSILSEAFFWIHLPKISACTILN